MALGGRGLEAPNSDLVFTSEQKQAPERLAVKEIYVSEDTKKLIVVFSENFFGEEVLTQKEIKFEKVKEPKK